MAPPKYNVGDRAYLRESAAVGSIEPIYISGVQQSRTAEWYYTVTNRPQDVIHTYGDRRSLVNNMVMYYSESEFVDVCGAIILAKAFAQAQLDKITTLQQRLSCH